MPFRRHALSSMSVPTDPCPTGSVDQTSIPRRLNVRDPKRFLTKRLRALIGGMLYLYRGNVVPKFTLPAAALNELQHLQSVGQVLLRVPRTGDGDHDLASARRPPEEQQLNAPPLIFHGPCLSRSTSSD
jgi:hypothetical protein